MATFSCDMIDVDSDKYSAKASSSTPPDDHSDSSCHSTESLLITAMNHDNHRRSSSFVVAEVPVREEETVVSMVSSGGASKSNLRRLPCPPHNIIMENNMIVMDSSLDVLSVDGVPTNNQIGVLSHDDDVSGISQPMVLSSSMSTLSGSVLMHDHQNIIEGVVSEDHNGHSNNNNKTRRVRTRLSSCNRGHCRRNNYGGLSNSSMLPIIIMMSLCWISLAAANVFGAATTIPPTIVSSTTTLAPLITTTTSTSNSSAVNDDDLISTTNATTAAPTNTTNATLITTTTTTTTTIGGLKLIDGDDTIPPCPNLNKGQCQQNPQHCTWIITSWSCDYFHLPVTSTAPPTSLTSRAPPTSLGTPSPQPSVDTTSTIPPVTIGGPPSGNKGLTDTPTVESSEVPTSLSTSKPTTRRPTPLPTPKPTTRRPTPVPTNKPTTREPTNVPTGKPTTKAPTKEPTDMPTTESPTLDPTRMPTRKPTRNPTPNPTDSPTLQPSRKPSSVPSMLPSGGPSVSPSMTPTASPSDFPSTIPTNFPTISPKPTPLVWPSASPTLSSSPTVSPSNRPSSIPSGSPSSLPTVSPTTPAPVVAEETNSPTGKPITPAPTSPPSSKGALQRVLIEKEPTSITLKGASKMTKGSAAYNAWEEATKSRIARYSKELIKKMSGEKDVDVMVTIEGVEQNFVLDGRRRRRRLGGGASGKRILQEEEMNSLRISFRTTLEFYSRLGQAKWDGSKLIGAGFVTADQQEEYISELRKEEQGSFGTVKSMAMSVNGQVITKEIDGGQSNNNMMYIIAGAVGGALVLFAIVGGVYYKKRRNNRRNSNGSSKRYPEKQSSSDFYNGSGNTGTMMSSPPTKSFPPPPPQSSSPVGDYFGTIEPRPGEDDVSTLGDPYIGDVHVNQAMGGDNTVTESLMSSGNDMYVYGISRPRMNTGDSSRMGGSTTNTGSNRMTFQDDGTMEEFYGCPDATNYHSEKDSNFEHITVVAASGVLGIVIDNPSRTTPVVHAIKESSILNGRVHVGDLLMSVDEVDCRRMTAVAVSKLIGSRSQNPTRTLRLLRGATLDDVRGDSSHVRY